MIIDLLVYGADGLTSSGVYENPAAAGFLISELHLRFPFNIFVDAFPQARKHEH